MPLHFVPSRRNITIIATIVSVCVCTAIDTLHHVVAPAKAATTCGK